MNVHSFRITNFRSIIDTGWKKFSPDNVTVLIGQNESGKTSILEALSKTFSKVSITDDDIRIGEPSPKVFLRIGLNKKDVTDLADNLSEGKFIQTQIAALIHHLDKRDVPIELSFYWEKEAGGENKYTGYYSINDSEIECLLDEALPEEESVETEGSETS